MFQTKHNLTEGEKKCLEEYEREKSKTPRKNLIRLVRHINMLNPVPMRIHGNMFSLTDSSPMNRSISLW